MLINQVCLCRGCLYRGSTVYAFLGLALGDEHVDLIRIDYTADVTNIWRSLVRVHLEIDGNLSIFDYFAGIDRPLGFSSWAHGITEETTAGPDMYEVNTSNLQIEFKASVIDNPDIVLSNGTEELLALRGVFFDVVEHVGEKYAGSELSPIVGLSSRAASNEGDETQPVFKNWQRIAGVERAMKFITNKIQSVRRDPEDDEDTLVIREPVGDDFSKMWRDAAASCSGLYPTGKSKLDAFIQTIMLDPGAEGESCERFQDRREILLSHKRCDPFSFAFASSALFQHRFFMTARGYFGIGPAAVSAGDKVVVFHGGKTPHILRREGEHHIIVGWTYVQDLMSGELDEIMHGCELHEERIILS